MKAEWTMLQRGDVAAQWAGVYVTMNRKGEIAMNGVTHRRMGGAEAFHVMFDRVNSRIGLKPTSPSMAHAYPARKYGRRGGRMVRAFRLLAEFGIELPDTMEFTNAEIDTDGQLILDLRTARVSPKAHSQCRGR